MPDKPNGKALQPARGLWVVHNLPGLMEKTPRWTPHQAWEKIQPWCAYSERSHYDTRQRLLQHGLLPPEADAIISRLIEANYLNEERFAIQYAGGHFRQKQWGKVKIAHALRQKQVSAYCIKKALATIPDDDYLAALHRLAAQKQASLGRATPAMRWQKIRLFLLQRGFEPQLVLQALREVGM